MDKKTLPLIILCIVLLVFWEPILNWLWVSFGGRRPIPQAPTHTTNQTSHVDTASTPSAPSAPTTPSSNLIGQLSTLTERKSVASLQNEYLHVELSDQSGGIHQVVLKKYSENEKPVILNEKSPIPALALKVGDVDFNSSYQITQAPHSIIASYQSPKGLQVSKEYSLTNDYQISSQVTLSNQGTTALPLDLQVALGMAKSLTLTDDESNIGISFLSENDATHETLPGISKFVQKQGRPFEHTKPMTWAALKNQYFTFLVKPSIPFTMLQAEPYSLSEKDPKGNLQDGVVAVVRSSSFVLPPGSSTNFHFLAYAGPNEYKRLSSLGHDEDEVLGFGMFGIFSKALIWLMGIFHQFFHNWGVAIIAVTVVIKILFWPLTQISTKSMKQMQSLAPQMNALKEKYKDDPKRMNEEVIKMYREYKINPMAGCLPILIQIPIFIAFYNLLRASIEIRGASFLWISDLSMPDTVARIPGLDFPINPMPLLMAASSFLQVRMTPQAPNADPSMKIMMWLMPGMFLLFCYNFSSGLSLYWTAQNLLTILQTYLTKNKEVEPPEKVKRKGGFTFSRPIEKKKN